MQNKTKNFLEEIIERKKEELADFVIPSEVEGSHPTEKKNGMRFFDSLSVAQNDKNIALIAEVKFASPTSPELGSSDELLERVKAYEKAGADAISIITEKHFFKGDVSLVTKVKKAVNIPVLQKDFVIDEKQIYEAKEIGSDALLLIARLIDGETLKKFVALCFELGIEPVVEVNSEEDLEKAVKTKTNIIAVNARDLETFVIDVEKVCELIKKIPDKFIKLGFSGINSSKEVTQYKNSGAQGVLIGTSLMKTKNIDSLMKNLLVLPEAPSVSVTRKFLSVKVKICGIQKLEDAEAAIAAGADYLGFIFVRDSKRATDRKAAKKVINKVRGKVKIVGVFRDHTLEKINELCEELDFDLVQLHGESGDKFYHEISRPVIRSFGLPSQFDANDIMHKMKKYNVKYHMIDRQTPGEGDALSIENAQALAQSFPLFVAGGLTPENVGYVVNQVKPFAVDVITGVKTDGKFDIEKMKKFIKNAKGVRG